jgi:lipoyl(octanoyl) transferase
MGADWYRARGLDIVDTKRGGRVTYHGPGQLVGYPIMLIGDVVAYIRTIERAIVAALAELGISAHARPDEGPAFTGVWTGDRKISSIGVHVARGVTTHGFSINVDNELEPFGWIVPCGLGGVQMTSVLAETGAAPPAAAVRAIVARCFADAFARTPVEVDPAAIDPAGPVAAG